MGYPLRKRTGHDLKHYRGFIDDLLEAGSEFRRANIEQYKAMEPRERAEYDNRRRKAITQGLLVRSDSYLNARRVLAAVMREHQYQSGGGHGVLISAGSFLGKTTVARILMLDILRQRLEQDPDCLTKGEVPVAYVNLPSTGTPLGLYRMLAYYYGIPIGKRETEATLEGMVQHAINQCRTEILVIDDVHNLKYGGAHSRKVSAAIRRLGDDIDCPILLMGIALEQTNLLTGQEGAQIFERYRTAQMCSYESINTEAARARWHSLVKTFVQTMPLFGNSLRGIKQMADVLHKLSDGKIGTLNSIISRTALDLIDAQDPDHEVISVGLAKAQGEQVKAENAFKEKMRERSEPGLRAGRDQGDAA